METVTGVVFRVYDNEFEKKTLYSVKLDGDDNFYGMGEKRFEKAVQPGNKITIQYDVNSKGKNVVKRVRLDAIGDPIDNKPKGGKGKGNYKGGNNSGGSNSMSKAEWADKDKRIQYQAARNSALEFLRLASDEDAIDYPKGATKTAKAARMTALEGLVDKYTALYFRDIENFSACERADAEVDAPAEVAAEPAKKTTTKSKAKAKKEEPEQEEDNDGFDDGEDDNDGDWDDD